MTRERIIKYAPLPSQARFHRSEARFKGFSGPVGSGKSQALCHEAIRLSYLNAGRTGLLGAPTYPMLRESTQRTFLEILSQNDIPYEMHKAENFLVMKDTGSRVIFRSLDDFDRLRGTNLAWFGVDELTYTTEEAWLRLEGRLRDGNAKRLCGFAVWTPKGFDWVYRRFIENPVPGYETILAEPFENRYLLGRVPDYYERLKVSYDPRFYEQEVLGKYLNVQEGQVYHSFDRRLNVAPCQLEADLPLRWSLDFNVRRMCSVVAQIRWGVTRVVDEIVVEEGTTYNACEEFLRRYGRFGGEVVIYGDASGRCRQGSGSTDFWIVRECVGRGKFKGVSFRFPKANPPVRERIALMNAMLRSAQGQCRLYIDPRCKELIADLERVVYKPGTEEIDKERDPRRTHLSDALGYLLWAEFRPMSRAGEQGRRLL